MISLEAQIIVAGYCTHPECSVIKDGRLGRIRFPAMAMLLRHPTQGLILVDTAYTPRFHEVTQSFPERFYALLTPVFIRTDETVSAQLRRAGIAPESIRLVILTHFHADHIGGAREFPGARFIFLAEGYRFVSELGRVAALRAGFLPALLPADFGERSAPIGPERLTPLAALHGLFRGVDIFGDGSLFLVDLPGHACGQAGLLFQLADARRIFLVVDAVWLKRSLDENRPPPAIAGFLMHDRRAFADTFAKLRSLQAKDPELQIVVTHCPASHAVLPTLQAAIAAPVSFP